MAKGHLDDLLPPLTVDDIVLMDEDLARLAEMTGRSERVAVTAGPILALWGGVMPLTALAFILRYIDILPPWFPVVPLHVVFGFGGTLWLLAVRGRNLKFSPWQSRALFIIWVFASMGLFIYNLGTNITGLGNRMLNSAVQCIIFGIAMAVMGAIGRRWWLLVPAAGWMATAFWAFFLVGVVERQSVLGLAAVAFMLIPGIVLSFDRKRV